MWLVLFALRRPYTIAMICLVTFLMGVLAITQMGLDVLPSINIPVVAVVWAYPGLSPEDMEKRVVYYTERGFSTTVDGIEHIESESIDGVGLIKLYFEEGVDIGSAISQVTAVTNEVLRVLPPGITPPFVLRLNASNVQVAQLSVYSDTLSEKELYDYGQNFLRLHLFTIPGLSAPVPYGGAPRQVMVDIDPQKCAASGLSPQDVVKAIQNQNVILPAGYARIGNTEYTVVLNSSPLQIADFNEMPIRVVNGAPVLLRDVAFVHMGAAVQENIVRINGKRATYISILRKAGASTLAVIDAVKKMIPIVKETAPKGANIRMDFDQSIFVRAAIIGVVREGALAAALVSLMVLGFLGSWRSTVIVATSIPLAILAGIIGLYIAGQSLNLMTLGGLSLAIGMLVDDATVGLENINRLREEQKPITIAVAEGARQVALPALAATLTICIVFTSVATLRGAAKYLFIPLALAVVFSMLASYVLSRTLVPAWARTLLAREPRPGAGGQTRRSRWARVNAARDRWFARFQQGYAGTLEGLLHHRALVLVMAAVFVGAAFFLIPVVGFDFFPTVDTGQMRLHLRGPVGTRPEATEQLVAAVDDTIRRIIPPEELSTINDNIGVPTPVNLAFVQSDNVGSWDADILIQLQQKHHPTVEYQRRIRKEIADRFPGSLAYFQAADVVTQVLNFGLPAAIDVQVEGRHSHRNFEIAQQILHKVQRIPGAVDARIGEILYHPALYVNVDRQRASYLGVTDLDVTQSVLTSLSSSILTAPSFWVDPQTSVNYPVVVQTPLDQVASVNELMTTPMTAGGDLPSPALPLPVPNMVVPPRLPPPPVQAPYMGGAAELAAGQDSASLDHYTVRPVVDVECSTDGRPLGAVAADIEDAIREVQVPEGIQVTVRGQSRAMTSSFESLGAGMLLALVLVYVLLVILFQSLRDPAIIMAALPGAFAGILWMLAVTGTSFNVESLMGSVMAMGIGVSNSILLVSFANEVRDSEGHDAFAAATAAGKTRLRPVLMTALAMILGMLPTALGLGEGGEQNAPLGRAVIGGLLVATFGTLFLVPIVYTVIRKSPPKTRAFESRLQRELQEEKSEEGEVAEPGERPRPGGEPPPLHS